MALFTCDRTATEKAAARLTQTKNYGYACFKVVSVVFFVHSHNSLPNMFEGLFHKLPHTVHLPSRYDEILWLLQLQHHPHSLKETDR